MRKRFFKKILVVLTLIVLLVPGSYSASKADCEAALQRCLIDTAIIALSGAWWLAAGHLSHCLGGYAWCLEFLG